MLALIYSIVSCDYREQWSNWMRDSEVVKACFVEKLLGVLVVECV